MAWRKVIGNDNPVFVAAQGVTGFVASLLAKFTAVMPPPPANVQEWVQFATSSLMMLVAALTVANLSLTLIRSLRSRQRAAGSRRNIHERSVPILPGTPRCGRSHRRPGAAVAGRDSDPAG